MEKKKARFRLHNSRYGDKWSVGIYVRLSDLSAIPLDRYCGCHHADGYGYGYAAAVNGVVAF